MHNKMEIRDLWWEFEKNKMNKERFGPSHSGNRSLTLDKCTRRDLWIDWRINPDDHSPTYSESKII